MDILMFLCGDLFMKMEEEIFPPGFPEMMLDMSEEARMADAFFEGNPSPGTAMGEQLVVEREDDPEGEEEEEEDWDNIESPPYDADDWPSREHWPYEEDRWWGEEER